jgi:predicted permease
MTGWLRRLRARIKYRRFEAEVAEEIATHRAMTEADMGGRGLTAAAARAAAARQLGNVTIAREEARAMWIPIVLQQITQDARYALRGMRHTLGFTIAAVLMLTVGLGLVAGGYTVVNGLFLRGWAVPDTGRVFRATASRQAAAGGEGFVSDGFSYGAFRYLVAHAQAADYVAYSFQNGSLSDRGGDRGTYWAGWVVSSNFFEVLRIPVAVGTGFGGLDGPESRLVISDRVWRRQFGADPAVVGRTLWLSAVPITVVGVMAPEFEGLGERRLDLVADATYARTRARRGDRSLTDWGDDETVCCVALAGRLRPEWDQDRALEELQVLATQYRRSINQPPLTATMGDTTAAATITRGGEDRRMPITLALVGAGLVLVMLLTCANVGNLFLARSLRREREIAMRLALGAGRARVIRQLLTEGLVLAAIAGAGAYAVTTAVPGLLQLLNDEDVIPTMFASDWRVAAFTAAGVVVTCLIVSLAPAIQTTRITWRGATSTLSAKTGRLRGAVLASQIAIATVLALSAALIARGIVHAVTVPADFALHTTAAIAVDATAVSGNAEARRRAVATALERAAAQDDLRVGLAGTMPASGRASLSTVVRPAGSEVGFRAGLLELSKRAADVLELRMASGRWMSDDPAVNEAVVNEALASRIWPGDSAIGRSLLLDFDRRTYSIVGVVRDAHLTSLSRVDPLIHTAPDGSGGLAVLLARIEPGLEARVARAVAAVHPSLSVTVTPLSRAVTQTLQASIAGATIAAALAMVALVLAIIGVFGVFSYLLEERRREIGIRLALGASRVRLGRALFHATRGAVIGGLAAGLALSAIAGVLLRSFLFGLSPADPVSYGAVALVLMTAALIATAIPLRRALRVDPAVTLKVE